jgi:hypothetical protein
MKGGNSGNNGSNPNKGNIFKSTFETLTKEGRKAFEAYHADLEELFLSRGVVMRCWGCGLKVTEIPAPELTLIGGTLANHHPVTVHNTPTYFLTGGDRSHDGTQAWRESRLNRIRWRSPDNLTCFGKMGFDRKQLKELSKPLYGFGGKMIELVGVITLSMSFDTPKNPHTEYITFDVVDMPYPYNAIFGRGLLNTFEAALCSTYLCLKILATDHMTVPRPGGSRG